MRASSLYVFYRQASESRNLSYDTEGSPYNREIIGSTRNVEVKISKMFQNDFKLKFLKGHFKIFHNNIFIFQPDRGLEKFIKDLHF